MAKKFRSTKKFEKALRVSAQSHPDSLLADLLAHFGIDIVIKLVQIYSGQHLKVPGKNEIWKIYRNKIIRHELDHQDNRKKRVKLARSFGISLSHISAILRKERKDHPKATPINVNAIARHIYDEELSEANEETIELFSDKT